MKMKQLTIAIAMIGAGAAIHAQAAETAPSKVQRVEVTGSSIKRIVKEGALPVQQVSKEEIVRSGATNVAELLQNIPAMQGFTVAAAAVGGSSRGASAASLHDIGTQYTLVLLNGRRLAPQGDGSDVDLNAIPMSAIERVEILTDGASAIYGSDAIAGVINFILKKNAQGGTVEASFTQPQESGGGAWNVSASYGFGNLDEDGFNVLASYRHDEQTQLKATDRSFANSGTIFFNHKGNEYRLQKSSPASVPANAIVEFKDVIDPVTGKPVTPAAITFNPYYMANKSCPQFTVTTPGNTCGFDFPSTLEIAPEFKRDAFFGNARFKINDNFQLFTELALSRFELTSRIAPNPVGVNIDPASSYYTKSIRPFLTDAQAANVDSVSANYRAYDWGGRTSNNTTNSHHFVFGGEGEFMGWNFNTGFTWSKNANEERYAGGYMRAKEFNKMVADVSFDPFAAIGNQSDATKKLIQESLYFGPIVSNSTTLLGVDAKASTEVFELPGGPASLGLGMDYRHYAFEKSPSQETIDGIVFRKDAEPAYDLKRATSGLFAELLLPVVKDLPFVKSLEISAAARYDSISGIDDALNKKTIGDTMSSGTYKLSARYQPVSSFLIRGSLGTGFKAPDMLALANPRVDFGVVSGQYDCPFPGTKYCRPTHPTQYSQVNIGNDKLKPEQSEQFTIGFRFEPSVGYSFGADLWDVKITDAVSSVSEQLAFSNPTKYKDLFEPNVDEATGKTYWAYINKPLNLGQQHNRGIDWDFNAREKLSFGTLSGTVSGTYLIESAYTVPGTDDEWTDSMGQYGINKAVSFRNLIKFNTSLETGALTNSFTVSYRSGYTDGLVKVKNMGTGLDEKIRLEVPSYTLVDWQGKYQISKAMEVRAGVKNIFNTEPPRVLADGPGHQVGFDPRYSDQMLRSFYMNASYKF